MGYLSNDLAEDCDRRGAVTGRTRCQAGASRAPRPTTQTVRSTSTSKQHEPPEAAMALGASGCSDPRVGRVGSEVTVNASDKPRLAGKLYRISTVGGREPPASLLRSTRSTPLNR